MKALALLLPALVLAAAVVAALPGTAQSAFPGQNGKIAFETFGQAGSLIHVVNPDGSGDTQLTTSGSDGYPAWSPDGRKIAFASFRDGNYEIYVMNADGSGQVRLTSVAGVDREPAWSPDGQRIAFTSSRDGNEDIYVMNADGSAQTRLTNQIGLDREPAWSPDGQRIAFTSGRDGNYEIYVMNADGSGQARLTDPDGLGDLDPDWSPDGQRIAFTSYRDNPLAAGVYVMNADGTGSTRLTSTTTYAARPAWSPDGQQVAFQDVGGQISAINADGSGTAAAVTTNADAANSASWQPLAAQPNRTATVQQPLEADGSSVFKAGKGVVPVKFTLAVDGEATCTLPPATLGLTKLSGAAEGMVNESPSTVPADSGSDFRVDDCQYVHNLGLKSLTAGSYRVTITIDGQAVGSATFALR